jgi:hypothetical protein
MSFFVRRRTGGTPSPPFFGVKYFDSKTCVGDGACKVFITKGFAAKVLVINKLAPEGIRGFLVFTYIFIIAGRA